MGILEISKVGVIIIVLAKSGEISPSSSSSIAVIDLVIGGESKQTAGPHKVASGTTFTLNVKAPNAEKVELIVNSVSQGDCTKDVENYVCTGTMTEEKLFVYDKLSEFNK